MLTPDEMARIEEEENKKHAEEQFRLDVRTRLQQSAKPKRGLSTVQKAAGVALLCIAVVMVISKTKSTAAATDEWPSSLPPKPSLSTTPRVRYTSETEQIASGQVVVPHSGQVFYRITITPEMGVGVVIGNFTAAGGSGNDVDGIIASEEEYTNWINGHQARAFWSTPGKATTGSFNVRLGPGTYYLALSNRFSLRTDKYVALNATLAYRKTITE
jgi:hypothetical protein